MEVKISHTTTLTGIEIKDERAIELAVDELHNDGVNITLMRNTAPRMYFGQQHPACDITLRMDDARYDLGLNRVEDGSFEPVFDAWAGEVAGQIGANCPMPNTAEGRAQHAIGRFTQTYAKHAAIRAAEAQGYAVERVDQLEDGSINVVIAA